MEIKADEITEILKRQLAGYEKAIDVAEVGTVLSLGPASPAFTASTGEAVVRAFCTTSSVSP